MKKTCSKCKEKKPHSAFNKRTASRDGLDARCGDCKRTKAMQKRASDPNITRAANLKTRFNISIDEYNNLFLKQKGKCAICHQAESQLDSKGKVKWLSVDHNHSKGDIRGLLCNSCNTGIGKLGDSITVLESAVKYLKKRGSYGK
jgi:hypothetical protein